MNFLTQFFIFTNNKTETMYKRINVLLLAIAVFIAGCESKESKQAKELEAQHNRLDVMLHNDLSLFDVLPVEAVSSTNPLTPEKVRLGHFLYFDSQLSKEGKNSCNSCHNLATFGVDNLPTSPGDLGKNGDRNSPTTLNAALHTRQFWDGRAGSIEEQAGMPILNPVEMNIPNEKFLVDRLSKIELYQNLFKEAYPDQANPITYENIKNAIGAFERKLITPSRFDDYLAGDKKALSVEEKQGMLTFIKTGCTQCHSGALLGGNMFQKFGVHDDYWKYTKSEKIDKGRFEVTKDEMDMYVFKSPSLRNIEKTGPYFHDGSVADLTEAVKIMATVQLKKELTDDEAGKIVTFLKALTSDINEEFKKAPDGLETAL